MKKIRKPRPIAKGLYLVSWKDMGEDPSVPLPMRSFETRAEAECYKLGCADVLCVMSDKYTDPNKIQKDFIITTDRD